ncbi:threonylcarbamoyl-AMP synthase [Nocardioides antri]|uniref:L-threonylcarbamoyladenylate synthase n=1 Tax=Nocardioides antri TaxID=2607659 RepID=A0A5B1M8S9_9ACTN|nr:threonylcarbamoyl-AMP synthase [Nocardioides antri]
MDAVSQSGSAQVYDASGSGSDDERETAVAAAALAIQRGRLVVFPTDTVYGIAADAFDAEAVQRLLDAKGRGREMPPPVLVSTAGTLDALATKVPDYARVLTDAFWPGPLTVVCHEQPSLRWDLGETRGTVAVRMPAHELAREILDRTGPLAVSSANLTGKPAATTASEAVAMLGDRVAVIVDGGPSGGAVPSTIVDVTAERPRLLRLGAISVEELDEALQETGLTVDADEATEA